MRNFLVCVAAFFGFAAFAASPGWLASFEQAQKFAEKSKRPILINFTGSDWCGWCKRMHRETLSTKEFIHFASSNLLLVELDFPNSIPQSAELKRANAAVKDQFRVTGFPTYVLVGADGKELGRQVGYLKGGAPAMTAMIEKWMGRTAKAPPAAAP
ncbi:MAG: thioredoxin family protein [Verrucomicrobia bacterium]|nr:thioredoxin family protein [Verrucomicrobiota bacterium]